MVYIRKNYVEKNKISYLYQPECLGDFGEVVFDINTNNLEVIKLAENDIPKNNFYLNHVYSMIMKFKEENNYLEENKEIWY